MSDYNKRGGYNLNRESSIPVKRAKLTDKNYVEIAETVMNALMPLKSDGSHNKSDIITTSKIRGLLSNISGIYNDVMVSGKTELDSDIQARLQYLKVQFIYEAGRDKTVNKFINEADIISQLGYIGNDKQQFIRFERYMEALVAYHKFYGGE